MALLISRRHASQLTKSFSQALGRPISCATKPLRRFRPAEAAAPIPYFACRAAHCEDTMSNPVVLITGGLTGIGRAAAVAFARKGAKVVVAGRRDEAGKALVKELRS